MQEFLHHAFFVPQLGGEGGIRTLDGIAPIAV